MRPSPEALGIVPYELMRRRRVVPLELRGVRLVVAMADPGDLAALDDVRVVSGREVDPVPLSREEIADLLREAAAGTRERPVHPALASRGGGIRAVEAVEALLALAAGMGASDVHLEPQKDGLFVRLRVDGVLRAVHVFEKEQQGAVVSRLKVLAAMDISERRLPLDGQFAFPCEGRELDLRVSTLPGKYGEAVVVRVLDKAGLSLGLESLGLGPAAQAEFEALVERPHGLVLVTGPTGSGKTTTLYSVLNRIRSPLKNVVTLEDPVEYELLAGGRDETGVTQVQVQSRVGLTFAAGLRAALRQDPDVIMVGEIRDRETAETAMTAAMTGHLVLSTLHTNDAASAVERLLDMGVEPYLVAASLAGVLAQRLLRLLCEGCKERYQPPAGALRRMFPERRDTERAALYRATGCERCHGSGYRGRRGVFELLTMNEGLKSGVLGWRRGGRLDAGAAPAPSLREHGLGLVLRGLTTVEEVARVTVA